MLLPFISELIPNLAPCTVYTYFTNGRAQKSRGGKSTRARTTINHHKSHLERNEKKKKKEKIRNAKRETVILLHRKSHTQCEHVTATRTQTSVLTISGDRARIEDARARNNNNAFENWRHQHEVHARLRSRHSPRCAADARCTSFFDSGRATNPARGGRSDDD